jgi:hypothetical protein
MFKVLVTQLPTGDNWVWHKKYDSRDKADRAVALHKLQLPYRFLTNYKWEVLELAMEAV